MTDNTRKPNGRSSIHYSPADGRWHGWVMMGVKDDGSPDRRHRTAKSETDVTAKVRALERKRDAGTTSKAGRAPTVGQWMATWLDTIATRKVSQSTMESTYRPKVERWIIPRLGKHRLDQLRPEHLDVFYTSLANEGLAPNTVLQIHRILSRALKVATQREIVSRNVATLVDAPQAGDVDAEPLSAEQARTLLALAGELRNGTRWSVAVALGLRQGEALGLRWKYVDLDKGVIKVHWQLQRLLIRHGCEDPHACGERLHRLPCPKDCPKRKRTSGRPHICRKLADGRKPALCPPDCKGHAMLCPKRTGGWKFTRPKGKRKREVPIPPAMLVALKAHKKLQDAEREQAGKGWNEWGLVWCQTNGRPIETRADWAAFKDLLRLAGIDADVHRLHDARHTAGTLMGEQGVDIYVIQQILGHAQLSTTRRYTHVTDGLTTEAMSRMGKALWA